MGTETATAIAILAIILVVLLLLAVRYMRITRSETPIVPDYRAFTVIGLAFIAIGAASGNWALLPIGLGFAVIGFANRKTWGQHTRWSDMPPAIRRFKLTAAAAIALLVGGLAAYFIVVGGI